jgi:LPXTG-motif cell wall-anchored protein
VTSSPSSPIDVTETCGAGGGALGGGGLFGGGAAAGRSSLAHTGPVGVGVTTLIGVLLVASGLLLVSRRRPTS